MNDPFSVISQCKSILKKNVSRINHIHCKDIRKNVLEKSLSEDLSFRDAFLEGVFTVPGDGCISLEVISPVLPYALGTAFFHSSR